MIGLAISSDAAVCVASPLLIPFHFKVDTDGGQGEQERLPEAGGVICIRDFVKWYEKAIALLLMEG
jgi:hypothetical protein